MRNELHGYFRAVVLGLDSSGNESAIATQSPIHKDTRKPEGGDGPADALPCDMHGGRKSIRS